MTYYVPNIALKRKIKHERNETYKPLHRQSITGMGDGGMKSNRCKILIGDTLHYITPELVAELFAEMYSDEQARFFNHIDTVASAWGGGGLPFQIQYITDDDGLTLAGRRVMQYIGEYSHWGLVPDRGSIEK